MVVVNKQHKYIVLYYYCITHFTLPFPTITTILFSLPTPLEIDDTDDLLLPFLFIPEDEDVDDF